MWSIIPLVYKMVTKDHKRLQEICYFLRPAMQKPTHIQFTEIQEGED